MGVTQQVRLQARSIGHRAWYLARTEGATAVLRRMAESAGLMAVDRPAVPPPAPVPEQLGPRGASAWPDSVLVVSSGGPRVAEIIDTGIPTLVRHPNAADLATAQQLVSMVYVLGPTNWSEDVAAQARRLRQPIALELGVQDLVDPALLARCDAVIVAAPRSLPPDLTVVEIPVGGDGIGPFLRGLREQV